MSFVNQVSFSLPMQLSLVVLMGVTCHLVLRLIISRNQSLVVKSQLKLVQEGNLVWGKFLLKLILENLNDAHTINACRCSVKMHLKILHRNFEELSAERSKFAAQGKQIGLPDVIETFSRV